MKKTILTLYALLMPLMVLAQKSKGNNPELIKGVEGELSLNYNEFLNISINEKLKLKDIRRIDKEFAILESLGEPLKKTYKDHIGYETWVLEYKDMVLSLINQNGYIEPQSITFYPKERSQFKLGEIALRVQTRLAELVTSKSINTSSFKGEVPVYISSAEIPKYPDIHFKIQLEGKHQKVVCIVIRFETT